MATGTRPSTRASQTPDETREFPHGRAEILKVGGGEVGRLVFEPGWRWSNDVKPIAGTDSCEAPHFQYHVSGRLRDPDGRRHRVRRRPRRRHLAAERPRRLGGRRRAGVVVDWYGASNYARPPGDREAPAPCSGVAQFNKASNEHDCPPYSPASPKTACSSRPRRPLDGERAVGKSALRAAWTPIFADASSTFTVEDSFSAGTRLVQRWL